MNHVDDIQQSFEVRARIETLSERHGTLVTCDLLVYSLDTMYFCQR